jgi:two-component system, LuxR family, sensor kinase FixL
MSWITVVFSMTASACLTMAFVYGIIWWRRRDSWAHLLFAVAALGAAALAACDLAALRAGTPAQLGSAIQWMQFSIWVSFLSLAGFVRLYLRAGRIWLLWTVCGLRTLAVLLNFVTGKNLNYQDITSLRHISLLGESVPIGLGPMNPWMLVGLLSLVALVAFVTDAAITAWRRGDTRQAVVVGGGIVFFVLLGAGEGAAAFWGIFPWPLTPGLLNVGIVAVMGYELAGEALRAGQLAQDLRASEQQMAMAAEAANLGFWFREFGRGEIWATDQWRALFGFTKSERLHHDKFLERLHPDDRDIPRQAIANANRHAGRYRAEYRLLLPDGRVRWIAAEGRVEFGRNAEPLRVQGVTLDITHSKQTDAEAEAHRNEVAHLMRAASLGELSSALAHELNQPLAAILFNAQAAQISLARESFDIAEIRAILQDIVADDNRASEVINRLRRLLKKGEFQPQPLETNDLIQEVLRLMNHDLRARRVWVITELAAGMPAILGDRVQLQQVLINLILNAGDAMSQPAHNARTLTLRSSRVSGNAIQISVADSGCGIPLGNEEKIFEPYHTTKAQGLGLGLSLSRSIVIAHHGRLWAENKPGGGAAFHFTIPEWQGKST